ncbi:MAG: hypothetical protein U0800_25740 [Isosphaeraceae bacterium]
MNADSSPENPANPSRSRENALTHGFTGEGVVLPRDLAAEVEDRRRSYVATYSPRTLHEHDLAHRAALGIVRHLHLQALFHRRIGMRSEQARVVWPLLRASDAIERSKRLAYNPPDVVAQLKMSLGGVAWLLHEWRMLRKALDAPEGWDWKLQSRAENLAGVARDDRRRPGEGPRRFGGGTQGGWPMAGSPSWRGCSTTRNSPGWTSPSAGRSSRASTPTATRCSSD